MDLKGRIAIVTGGSRGIGKAICDYLASFGATIYVADIDSAAAGATAREITSRGFVAKAIEADISKKDSVQNLADTVEGNEGRIDILVNNAGLFSNKPIHELTIEEWDRLMSVNLRGTHMCSQAVIAKMIPRRSGKIVNMGSMSAQTGGLKAGVDYSVSKGGVHTLTKSYARYAAQYNITVNAVAPGFILTDMTRSWASKPGAGDDVPMKRIGDPLDVAKVVFFLASPLSDYVTGQVISVNGGIIMNN